MYCMCGACYVLYKLAPFMRGLQRLQYDHCTLVTKLLHDLSNDPSLCQKTHAKDGPNVVVDNDPVPRSIAKTTLMRLLLLTSE